MEQTKFPESTIVCIFFSDNRMKIWSIKVAEISVMRVGNVMHGIKLFSRFEARNSLIFFFSLRFCCVAVSISDINSIERVE